MRDYVCYANPALLLGGLQKTEGGGREEVTVCPLRWRCKTRLSSQLGRTEIDILFHPCALVSYS